MTQSTAAGAGLAAAMAGAPLAPGVRALAHAQGTPVATPKPAGLALQGISYDVGIEWAPGEWSRPTWVPDVVRQDIAVIRNDLHCNAITLYGANPEHVIEAGRIAQEHDLTIWLQPRLVDGSQEATLEQLVAFARGAAALGQDSPDLVLNCGCELTVFMQGIIPGATYLDRIITLAQQWESIPDYVTELNGFLEQAITAVREEFTGPISYGSGSWETIDWSAFDYIGLNHYRNSFTPDEAYVETLRAHVGQGKPVVITEFGCCTFEGAAEMGGEGWGIVDWSTVPPQLNGDYVRSEAEQATELLSLLDIFVAEGVHGAFVFTFIQPDYPYSPDPRYDLDMASFSVVKTFPADSGQSYAETGYWEPKQSFHALAERYGTT